MKFLFLALTSVLALSSNAIAKQITIDGLKSQYKTQLTAEVTHTEYRQEQRETTCSRQVPNGYHEECRDYPGTHECREVGGGRECRQVGGGQQCGETPSGRQCFDLPGHEECFNTPGQRECYDTPGHRQCHTVQDTRTEYYQCTKTISVPYIVKDADIENDVVVNVEINRALPNGVNEVIDFVQDGKVLILKSVQSTAKVLVIANQQQNEISNNGRIIKQQTVVSIKLIDRQAALGPFLGTASELTFDAHGLQITTGLITDVRAVRFDLEVRRHKFLGKDEIILQRSLEASEMTFANNGGQTLVSVDFQKLGLQDKISGKKIKLVLQMQLNVNLDNVVNRQDVPANLVVRKEADKKL